MQHAVPNFSKSDLAKYPFLKETTESVKKLNLKDENLVCPNFARVRACRKLEEDVQEPGT